MIGRFLARRPRVSPAASKAGAGLALVALAASGSLLAGPALAAPTLDPVREGAWIARIDDGPRLLLIPQRSVPMFSCTVFVPAGSALETPETNGAAHYLEHLLFNGTTRRAREEIYALGDRLGAYNNASTQRERSVFQLLLPSENWREGLDLQADMLLNSTLPRDMFEKEKGIILEELAKDRTDPEYEAERFRSRVQWGDDPRALPVLGTEESIANMDYEALAGFYREGYRPDGMTIVLMGDFDPTEAATEIERLYGGRPGASPPLPPRPDFPIGRSVRVQSVTGLTRLQVRVRLPLPAISPEDHATARILEALLTDGQHSSLSRAVEAAGISPLGAWASVDAGEPGSILTLGADLPPESFGGEIPGTGAPAAGHLLAHLARFAEVGPAPDELEAARRSFAADEIGLQEKMHYYGLMRADVLGSDRPEAALGMVDALQGDVAVRVKALARAALADGRISVTVAGDAVEDGLTIFAEFSEADASEWLPEPETMELESLDFSAPPVTASADGIRRETLGVDGPVLLLQTSRDSRTFAAHVLVRDRAGSEAAAGVPRGAADVVHRMMGAATESLDENELRGRLSALGAKLKTTDAGFIPYDDYYFSPEYSYVRLETIDTFGLEALALMADALLHPRFDEDGFERARAAAIDRARKEADSPRDLAARAFHAALGEGHPLAAGVLGPPEELETLTLEDARRLHGVLVDPARLVIAVSSSLDPAAIRGVLAKAFAPAGEAEGGGSPAGLAAAAFRAGDAPYPRRVEVEAGKEQSWIQVGAPLEVPESDRAAVGLATAVLSERLAEQLRESEGLAYSIGAAVRFDGPGPYVRMAAGTRPENLERMHEGMREVARGLVGDPPGLEEIEGARNRGEGRRRMRRLARIGQAYALSMLELRGHDPTRPDEDLPAIRAVTPDDVVRVAREHLGFDREVVAIAR